MKKAKELGKERLQRIFQRGAAITDQIMAPMEVKLQELPAGHEGPDSEEIAALLVAFDLIRAELRVYGSILKRGIELSDIPAPNLMAALAIFAMQYESQLQLKFVQSMREAEENNG